MTRRGTTETPACNIYGVPYRTLLLNALERNARTEGKMIEALRAWLEADDMPANSARRWAKMKKARNLTEKALS